MMVRTLREGYYGAQRRQPGSVFNFADKDLEKGRGGALILPDWVESADKPQKKEEPDETQQPSPEKGQQVI